MNATTLPCSRRELPIPAKLDFAWAEKRWRDPVSGVDVVRLSPARKRHYRHNYFRINEMTWDGRYIVFTESTELKGTCVGGEVCIVARDLTNGAVIDLGPIPLSPEGAFEPTAKIAVARHSHLINVIDTSDPGAAAVIQIDIDTGLRRRIELSEKIADIYEASFDASEQFIYTPWLKEKTALRRTMPEMDFRAMVAAQPGEQHMARIDLASGEVRSLLRASTWWMGHPNPHPCDPNIFMCCQEWCGEDANSRWGACTEHQRVRVLDVGSGQWFHERLPHLPWAEAGLGVHEHWAPNGKRIYSHFDSTGRICAIDLEQGTARTYTVPDGHGTTWHVMIAPNERFLVGDGVEFDRAMPAEFRARTLELDRKSGIGAAFASMNLHFPDGGETIWLYRMPERGSELQVSPLCKRRTLCRGPMFGQRLESNAHITPDSRWAVFVSASEDDWFEVWAARIPSDLAE